MSLCLILFSNGSNIDEINYEGGEFYKENQVKGLADENSRAQNFVL